MHMAISWRNGDRSTNKRTCRGKRERDFLPSVTLTPDWVSRVKGGDPNSSLDGWTDVPDSARIFSVTKKSTGTITKMLQLLVLFLFHFCIVTGRIPSQPERTTRHRVFPAAQVENYSDDDHTFVGFVKPQSLSFQGTTAALQHAVLATAIQQFHDSLYRLPDFKDEYQVNPDLVDLFEIPAIHMEVTSLDFSLYHGVDESYQIHVDDLVPLVTVKAPTIFGARHGMETLAQLLEFGWMDDNEPIYLLRGIPLTIVDAPAYSFRGLLIDTGRHFLPMNLILDTLHTMAMNKMNILHWHLVDEQFFPYQMETYPEIAQKGSYHPHRVYTTKDIQRVIQEAYQLGIRVIPELDLPGHTHAIGKSHPEWMAFCPDPASLVDATKPEVYSFVENVYKDLGNLFPDEMVHVGGDEVQLTCWQESESISSWMKEHNMSDPVQLYEYFETRLLGIVDKFQKTPIVWQEVFNLNLTITPETVVDVWKGFDTATIEAATAQNFRVVLSGCWYLDHLDKNWQDFYACDPRNFTSGNPALMIGGHASMWGEHVDASNFVSRTWPRASAAAERLWTGNVTTARGNIQDRMHQFRCRMVQQGIAAGPTGPGFCPHEVPYDSVFLSKDEEKYTGGLLYGSIPATGQANTRFKSK